MPHLIKLYVFLITLIVAGVSSSASAQTRSKFEVSGRETPKMIIMELDFDHHTKDGKAEIYLHSKLPSHSSSEVQKGHKIGVVDLVVGKSQITKKVKKADLIAAGLDPENFHVAVHWPDFSHNWGTDFAAGHHFNTAVLLNGAVNTGVEDFSDGMPLEYTKPLYRNGKALDVLGDDADIASLGQDDQNNAKAGSLLERESKVGFKNKKQLRAADVLLRRMVTDPKLANKVIGPGWTVAKLQNYTFEDIYTDKKDLDRAKKNAGIRFRNVPGSGQPGQMNYKAEGGTRDGANNEFMNRIERIATIGPNVDRKKLVRSKSALNPAKPLLDAGKDPVDFLNDASRVPDRRNRFQLLYADPAGNGPPDAIADISLDDVFAFEALLGNAKHKKVSFFGVEMEVQHPPVNNVVGQTASHRISSVKNWKPLHEAADMNALASDPKIKTASEAMAKITNYWAEHGVKMKAVPPKHSEGHLRSGTMKPQDQIQKNVLVETARSL